ncbi:Histidine protein kinase DivJ [Alteripontixanthobacter maritimus]|uniref:histidine kinase n=1 Tax=Alteripontixanthobacter maritimus TaxID=2161824 RepID=A0A369QCL6_9SPHN|nr:HAMP domain-containing sensor histidine kinase [Alteripontixanthobacter maritimus]RDC60028.1 Histidine protein kinase DivJ [Alteripontixanthobacter maritimus]
MSAIGASSGKMLAYGRTDADGQLLSADEPLATLQKRCGGTIPGRIAIPELSELVHKARTYGFRIARPMEAMDGEDVIRSWVEIIPMSSDDEKPDGPATGGFEIGVATWQTSPIARPNQNDVAERKVAIDRHSADLTARLDKRQHLLSAEPHAVDTNQCADRMLANIGRPWTDFVTLEDAAHQMPLHWRLMDGSICSLPGSDRRWTAHLVPLGVPEPGGSGFELLLVADTPIEEGPAKFTQDEAPAVHNSHAPRLGSELSPVLRQPIARIIANAETIRTKLAGPLADEYSNYAADIATAGQHLLSLIDDLSDLEVLESGDFSTAADRVNLGDAAQRAAGILAVKAAERKITLVKPEAATSVFATAEDRRVLQILLNLVGNAMQYSPEGSAVTLSLKSEGDRVGIAIADEGKGLTKEQQAVVFDKFERLGRGGDGGSGLGLYISRSLARAMGGDLVVSSEPDKGATFTLLLPAAS